jgi:hypothetical protein
MKRPARLIHFVLAFVCISIFCLSIFELIYQFTPAKKLKLFVEKPPAGLKEEYLPELNYINSVSKLDVYTDSLVSATAGNGLVKPASYPLILNDVIRKRFYHGVYRYTIGNNFFAFLGTKLSGRSWNEVWVANDILKSPHAFCGQQSLVEMSLLIKKGYPVRSVRMFSPTFNNGHFAFEVFYDNSWHFFDPDMEPNASLLQQMGRPSVASLVSLIQTDKNNLASIYPHAREEMMIELFQNIRMGEVNKLMPQRIYNFASFTKFISYISWLLSALFYFFFLHRLIYQFPGLRIKNYYRAKEQEPVPSI